MRRALVPLLLVVLVLPPAAVAQAPDDPTVSFTAEPVNSLVRPFVDELVVRLWLNWSCSQQELAGGGNALNVSFTVQSLPTFASAAVSRATVTVPATPTGQCTDGAVRHRVETNLTFSLDANAPALQDHEFVVAANITQPRPGGGENHWGPHLVSVAFTPAYVARFGLQADSDLGIIRGPDGVAEFSLVITNLANGRSSFTYEFRSTDPEQNITFSNPNGSGILLAPWEGHQIEIVHFLVGAVPARFEGGAIHHFEARFTVASASADPRATSTDTQTLALVVTMLDPTEKPVASAGPGLWVVFLVVIAGILVIVGLAWGRTHRSR